MMPSPQWEVVFKFSYLQEEQSLEPQNSFVVYMTLEVPNFFWWDLPFKN